MITAAAILCRRELVRFYRDRSRLIGALAPPVLFWFLIGSGLGPSVLQYFYTGTLVLIVLFTSVFATISIIEDRREGFLQSILVAPISRLTLAMGKIAGASLVGLLQGLTFLVFAGFAGLHPGVSGYLLAAAALALISVGLTGLGFCIAWRMDSSQGFHAVMNLFLIPLWMLSGAMFPLTTAPAWMRWVMSVNPVTYSVSALVHAMLPPEAAAGLPGVGVCLAVLGAFALLMTGLSAYLARD